MSNNLTGLLVTLVPCRPRSKPCSSLRYTKAASESIFWDYKGTGGRIGQTLNAPIVISERGSSAVDIGSGPLQVSDTDLTSVPIVLNQHTSVSFVIKAWDQESSA